MARVRKDSKEVGVQSMFSVRFSVNFEGEGEAVRGREGREDEGVDEEGRSFVEKARVSFLDIFVFGDAGSVSGWYDFVDKGKVFEECDVCLSRFVCSIIVVVVLCCIDTVRM